MNKIMEKHIYKLLAVIFILQVLVSLNGCALDVVGNTSRSENMYKSYSYLSGRQIVVDGAGNHLTDYTFDEKGNIVSFLNGKVVVLEAAVEEFRGSYPEQTVAIIQGDVPDTQEKLESTSQTVDQPKATAEPVSSVQNTQQPSAEQGSVPVPAPVHTVAPVQVYNPPVNYTPVHIHDYEKSIKSPTCTQPGSCTYKCADCGYTYTEQIPAEGHRYNLLGTCTKCGYSVSLIRPHEHSYDSGRITIQPGCTTTGVRTYTCTGCGTTKTETIGALGHNMVNGKCSRCGQSNGQHTHTWDSGRITRNPTCTENGVRTFTCTSCGTTKQESIVAAGHSYNLLGKCTVCGHSREIIHTHTWNSGTVTTQPSCTTTGVKTYTCTSCGATKTEVVPASGHSYRNYVCTKCGTVDPSHPHNYGNGTVTRTATCTDSGTKTYTCSICGNRKTETIPAAGHNYVNSVCTRCHNTDPAHAHNYGSGTVTKPATCTASGVRTYTCSVCGNKKTETIPATGHSYVNGVCSGCGKVDETYHVHTWDEGRVTLNATCLMEGKKVYTCTSCGEKKTEMLPKGPHTYKYGACTYCGTRYGEHEHEYVLEESIEPTCTTDGYDYYVCKYCGVDSKKWKNAAHKFDNNGVCTVCGYSDEDKFTVYGRQLRNSGMSDYDKMMAVANFVAENGYGACTGYAGQCIRCATEAGLRCEFRTTQHVDCIFGYSHDFAVINAKGGYCECGLGDNHNWNRFYIGNDYYEFDLSSYGAYCKGPNIFMFGVQE